MKLSMKNIKHKTIKVIWSKQYAAQIIMVTLMALSGCDYQNNSNNLKNKFTGLEKIIESTCGLKPRLGYQASVGNETEIKYIKITFYSSKVLCSSNELKVLAKKYTTKEFGIKDMDLYIELYDGDKFDMKKL